MQISKIPFLIISFLLLSCPCFADEEPPVNFEADRLDYYHEKGIIEGRGNVRVSYKEMELKADYIWFDRNSQALFAKGNVSFREKGEKGGEICAKELKYNLGEELGEALEACSFQKPWYVKARQFTKITPNEYLLRDGSFTTCDLASPHYRFTAKRIKVYPGDRLVAYHAVFYAGKIPLMYLPFYRRSLKDVPSGFIVRPGYSSKKGAYVLSHYNWYLSEKLNGRWYLDYFDRRGWGEGFDVNFVSGVQYPGSGYLYGYYIDERESPREGEQAEERWKLHFRHWQRITANTTTITRIDKLSDAYFNGDYLDGEVLRFLSRSELESHRPEGSFSITAKKSRYTSSLYVRKRVNNFLNVTESLPRVSFDLVESVIPGSSFYYDFGSEVNYLHVSPAGEDVVQVKVHPQVSHQTRLGWLRAKPAVRFDGYWYGENELGEKNLFQETYQAILATTMANGIWKVYNTDRWRVIKKVRHLISPRLTYYYMPEPDEERENVYSFCDVIGSEQSLIKVELSNSLEGKSASGKKFNMVSLDLNSFYNRLEENEPWSNIFADLKTDSIGNISWRTRASFNPYLEKFEAVGSDLTVKRDKWNFSTGARFYEPGGEKHTFDIVGGITGNLGRKWRVALYGRYDMNVEDFNVRRITLCRDLHCWEAQIFFQKEGSGEEEETSVFLAFKIKGVSGTALKTGFEFE